MSEASVSLSVASLTTTATDAPPRGVALCQGTASPCNRRHSLGLDLSTLRQCQEISEGFSPA